MPSFHSTQPVWTVVLAAGAGRRLSSLTGSVPKQFWSGTGGLSLLEETVRRFKPVSDRERRVVIAAASHRRFLETSTAPWGTTVYQPLDRGTAAGVLLSLTPVLRSEPDAIVVVTPSDHGVEDDGRFLEGIEAAIDAVAFGDHLVLFGVEPTADREDYGWILPGHVSPGTGFRRVAYFVEKPERSVAEQLLRDGAIWNTMVIAGRASTIRDLCFRHVPELRNVFKDAMSLTKDTGPGGLDALYHALPPRDFSRDVLGKAGDLLTYIWPVSMGWSDLGTPERMCDWLNRSGRSIARSVHAA